MDPHACMPTLCAPQSSGGGRCAKGSSMTPSPPPPFPRKNRQRFCARSRVHHRHSSHGVKTSLNNDSAALNGEHHLSHAHRPFPTTPTFSNANLAPAGRKAVSSCRRGGAQAQGGAAARYRRLQLEEQFTHIKEGCTCCRREEAAAAARFKVVAVPGRELAPRQR